MVPAAMDSNRKARNRPPEERGRLRVSGEGGLGHKRETGFPPRDAFVLARISRHQVNETEHFICTPEERTTIYFGMGWKRQAPTIMLFPLPTHRALPPRPPSEWRKVLILFHCVLRDSSTKENDASFGCRSASKRVQKKSYVLEKEEEKKESTSMLEEKEKKINQRLIEKKKSRIADAR
ncbi:hypothetical protein CDAR_448231 [Caerostris darwini]|uniref:Uncharacterized protein n=1 Tax=Caerostris darwini TaxID=1538125 RepID=A0AAV4SC95_9ARAC|nr:hypothetical protein CDAR_448231 [Caerostris darwini]